MPSTEVKQQKCPACKVPLVLGSVDGKPTWICPSCWRPVESQQSAQIRQEAKRNKYGAKKADCTFGHSHASRKEAMRCEYLHYREKKGEIDDLESDVPPYSFDLNGVHIGKYKPDFRYVEMDELIVEDTKSSATKTTAYRLRKRLLQAFYGLVVRET